ncbi:MAG TPA: hypothetical protein VK337_11825 [Xanthobacteraceae bacterium]|nr:hypothetical protein [Xanthobacteraceae bacterium]
MRFRLFAAFALALALAAPAAPANAQTVYRKDVPAGVATPTNGTFSIRFPVTFSDVELKAADPPAPAAIVRMLTGLNIDNVRFSATETPMLGLEPRPMEDFMAAMKQRPGATVSDVHREGKDGAEILSFALADASGGYFFHVVRADKTQYMQVIQFPETARTQATAVRDDFFNSFKITKP